VRSRLFYIFVFAIPFLRLATSHIPVPVTTVFVALFAAKLALNMVQNNDEYLDGFRFTYLFLFVWIALAHSVNTVRLGFTFDEIRLLAGRVSFAILVFMTYYVTRSFQDFNKVQRIVSYSVLLLSSLIIIFSIFHFDPFGVMTRHPRTYWGMSMPFNKTSAVPMSYGEFAIIVVSALPALTYSLNKNVNIVSIKFAAPSIIVILLAAFITQSRNTWLSVAVTFMSLFFLSQSKGHRSFMKVNAVLGGLSLITLSAFLFHDITVEFINGFVSSGVYRENVLNRLGSYRIGVELFLNNALIGVGNSNIEKFTGILHNQNIEIVMHNAFVDQLAGTGLVGFTPFLLIFAVAFYQLLKISRSENAQISMYGRLLLSSFVGSMCALQFYRGFFSEMLAVELGLVMSLWDRYRYDICSTQLITKVATNDYFDHPAQEIYHGEKS
jgi:hypothetical protein